MTGSNTQPESNDSVELNRKILELGLPASTLGLYVHCLMMAKSRKFITTNKELERTLNLTTQMVRSGLKILEKSRLICRDARNKFSVITIIADSD